MIKLKNNNKQDDKQDKMKDEVKWSKQQWWLRRKFRDDRISFHSIFWQYVTAKKSNLYEKTFPRSNGMVSQILSDRMATISKGATQRTRQFYL